MQACLTVHPPDEAAIVRTVPAGDVLRIGRGADCGLRVVHPSVSRTHAELRYRRDGWQLRDLGSKNGSYVDGQRLDAEREHALERPAWLRFGDVYCEFVLFGEDAAARAASDRHARRAAATAHTARLDAAGHLGELLDASLQGVLELAQCERGFVLLRQRAPGALEAGTLEAGTLAAGTRAGDADAGFVVAASRSLDPAALAGSEFSGSVGAVQRALHGNRSVIANDIVNEAWLSSRASVAAAGLSALVCLPLHDAMQPLGAIYADRTRPGPPLTTLDQELLEAFAERAALWIAARRASELLAVPSQAAQHDWARIVAAHPAGAR